MELFLFLVEDAVRDYVRSKYVRYCGAAEHLLSISETGDNL